VRERIEHEHTDRVTLEEARQALLKRKQSLIAENMKRKEVLANLDKKIEDWVEGSEAVEKEFAVCGEEMGKVGVVKGKDEPSVGT
jgi:THO complex subunit 5